MPKSDTSRAETTLPFGIVPAAAGSSSSAFAARILSSRLLICPPVLTAENSPPMWLSDALGGLQTPVCNADGISLAARGSVADSLLGSVVPISRCCK